jgi:hypothetical protein
MPAGGSDGRKWWTVGAVSLVFLPLVIDFYGIVVALPAIGRDLHSSAVGPAERAEIGGLLSGSPDAVTALARLAAAAAAEVEQIVRASYDHGFEAGMILCAALSLAGVAVALIGTGTRPRARARPAAARSLMPRAFSGGLWACAGRRAVFVLLFVVARLRCGHRVDLAEPAPKIDVAAARRAERPEFVHAWPAADRAARALARARLLMAIFAHRGCSSSR